MGVVILALRHEWAAIVARCAGARRACVFATDPLCVPGLLSRQILESAMRLSRYFLPILRETPKEAEVYDTYLKKLSAQEKEIDALTAKQKGLMADEFAAHKKYEDFLAKISD